MNSADSQIPSQTVSAKREWLQAALVSLGVAVAIVAPFLWLANPSGHDIAFHASSWVDAAGQWKEGILFPRWTEWANYGYGEPRFIFYPPLSWMLGGALVSLIPIKAVAGIFIILSQTLAGISAYALTRRLAPRRCALAAGAAFAANPDALLIIYVRSDYAELLAIAFYPLLMLAALPLCGYLDDERGARWAQVVFFAFAFAAIWLANAPAGVIATYTAALLFTCAAITQKRFMPFVRGTAGIGLGLGLAAFYLVPAAYEQRWVNIGQALSKGLTPRENFLFTTVADRPHTHFNYVASAMAVLTMLLIAVFACIARRRSPAGRKAPVQRSAYRLWTALLVLAAAASLLMVKITLPLWHALPKLRFVQFPWRWMSVLAVAFCVFFACALSAQKRLWPWLAAVFLVLAGAATYLGKNTWWDADDFPTIQYEVELGHGFEGTDEYDPRGDDHLDLAKKQPPAKFVAAGRESISSRISVRVWTANHRVLEVHAEKPQQLALRLLDYPAWRVTVNGQRIPPDHLPGARAMVLPVPAGDSTVEARFIRTLDRTVGDALSAAGTAIAGLLLLIGRRTR